MMQTNRLLNAFKPLLEKNEAQDTVLQSCCSSGNPEQNVPPLAVIGLLQVRFRLMIPPPQG
jgi:hypothetical protein